MHLPCPLPRGIGAHGESRSFGRRSDGETGMKLVLFGTNGKSPARLGVLDGDFVIDGSGVVPPCATGQMTMQSAIDGFDSFRPALEALGRSAPALPLHQVRLFAPLPRPGKIVNCIANYWENAQRAARPLNMFLKNPDAVIGPGDTIMLPDFDEPSSFMHEAELALVLRGPVKSVAAQDWRRAVFGYTCLIDVTARGEGRRTWRDNSWMGKSFDTFAPIGPCIVTADEIADPNDLHGQFWNDGELRHNYTTDDMEHRVPEIIAWLTRFMTLNSGDVIACGTNHEGLGFLQDGETVEIAIGGIGRMTLHVVDPLKRTWPRGVYLGPDSTHHDAVRRYRPDTVLKAG
jgi:2-keto-4-pentenoate hydratase/2-oxohepta-3-ene-1,7-dioic acid hydratase in catechol pathway